jgi:hypothetical protein
MVPVIRPVAPVAICAIKRNVKRESIVGFSMGLISEKFLEMLYSPKAKAEAEAKAKAKNCFLTVARRLLSQLSIRA